MLQDIKQDLQRIGSDGLLETYDSTRGKWLSVTRPTYSFGIRNRRATGYRWFRMAGNVLTNLSGYKIERDATITAISFQAGQSGTGAIQVNVLRAGSQVPIHLETITALSGKVVGALNYDINSEDALTAVLVSGQFNFPEITVTIAYR